MICKNKYHQLNSKGFFMETVNCKVCGKIFIQQFGDPICAKCRIVMDEKFDQVKEYVYNNPHSSIQIVSEVNDVPVRQIVKWVREERLEFTADSLVGIECEICSIMIKTGHFCKECKDDLALKLGRAYDKPIPEEIKKELKQKKALRILKSQNN